MASPNLRMEGGSKDNAGILGNERADQLAGVAAEGFSWLRFNSITYLKLLVSEKYWSAKEAWHRHPDNHGSGEVLPPPPKKSCLGHARNGIARAARRYVPVTGDQPSSLRGSKAAGQPVLVLPERRPDDKILCASSLS